MTYLITGSITYSTTNARNSALTALNDALASSPVTPVAGVYAAGVNNPTGNVITISVTCDDSVVESVREAFRVAWTSQTKSTVQMGAAKI